MDDSDSPEDLLLNPCQCMGSCGTIHLQCLREWVSIKKLIKYKDEFTEIDFSKIKCEICKSPFYSMFQYKGLNSFLIQLKRPRDNYVILESESHTGVRKAIILHDLPSSGVSLGRFSKSHIFDDDKTISRSQSFFKKV